MCSHGNYHVPPYMILYLLDEQSGEPLPRNRLRDRQGRHVRPWFPTPIGAGS